MGTAELVIKCLAGLASLVMIFSPAISLYRIHKNKDVGVASVVPLMSLLANSHVWLMYGYMTKNWFPIFSVFVVGDVMALCYLAIYWRYTTERQYVTRAFAVVLAVLAVLSTYVIIDGLGVTGQTRDQVSTVLGYICDVVAVCLYGAPMEKLFHVLKYRSAIFINVHMVIAGTTNNCLWFTYGVLNDNWFIISPNILFMTIGSFSLVLYGVFNPKTHPLPASFYQAHDGTPHTGGEDMLSSVSVELTPKVSTGGKSFHSPRSPADVEALQSPLQSLPW